MTPIDKERGKKAPVFWKSAVRIRTTDIHYRVYDTSSKELRYLRAAGTGRFYFDLILETWSTGKQYYRLHLKLCRASKAPTHELYLMDEAMKHQPFAYTTTAMRGVGIQALPIAA